MPQTVVHVATISSIKNLQTFDPNIISSLINKKIERESLIRWERFHCFDFKIFIKFSTQFFGIKMQKIVSNKYTTNLCQTVR